MITWDKDNQEQLNCFVLYKNNPDIRLVGILSDEFKAEHADIPWTQIKKMRNIVAHRYGTVDTTITWDVVQEDIPDLKKYCSSLIVQQ